MPFWVRSTTNPLTYFELPALGYEYTRHKPLAQPRLGQVNFVHPAVRLIVCFKN